MGGSVGSETWNHEKTQALLKKEQAVVEEKTGTVHALARRILREHEEFQESRGGRDGGDGDAAAAAAGTTFQRPADQERELMNKLDFGLGEAAVEVRRPHAYDRDSRTKCTVSQV